MAKIRIQLPSCLCSWFKIDQGIRPKLEILVYGKFRGHTYSVFQAEVQDIEFFLRELLSKKYKKHPNLHSLGTAKASILAISAVQEFVLIVFYSRIEIVRKIVPLTLVITMNNFSLIGRRLEGPP